MSDRDPIHEARVKWDDAELGDRNFDRLKAAFEDLEKAAVNMRDDLKYEIDAVKSYQDDMRLEAEEDASRLQLQIDNGIKAKISDKGMVYDQHFIRVIVPKEACEAYQVGNVVNILSEST